MKLDRDGTALAAFFAGTVLAGGNAVGVSLQQAYADMREGEARGVTDGCSVLNHCF
jgi:hypothetical protein